MLYVDFCLGISAQLPHILTEGFMIYPVFQWVPWDSTLKQGTIPSFQILIKQSGGAGSLQTCIKEVPNQNLGYVTTYPDKLLVAFLSASRWRLW